MTLSIRYAQEDITPTLDRKVYLAGFGHNRLAQSVHDSLSARLLVIESDKSRLALLTLDLLGLFRHHCQEIEQRINREFPSTRLILCCTHTHHGPDTLGLWGRNMLSSGVDKAYVSNLKDKLFRMVCAALSNPAQSASRIRFTSVEVQGVAKNARDPDIVDQELTCLQFCREDDRGPTPLVTLLIFPCHPEVLWAENTHITADYPGFLRNVIEAQTGAPCLFFSGALGGMMTPDVRDHSFEEAEQMGHTLARAALNALSQSGETVRVDDLDQPRLSFQQQSFTIPLTNPLYKFGMIIGVLPSLPGGLSKVITEANLLRIGPVWLATVPGELLPKLGLEIKSILRQAGAQLAGVIGLANDELGYIIPAEDFVFPKNPFKPENHYEETNSVGPEAGPRLLAAIKSLISS